MADTFPKYHSDTWREHDTVDVLAKRVKGYIWDADGMQWVKQAGNSDGEIQIDPESFLPSSSVISHSTINTIAGNAQTTVLTYNNVGVTLWLDGFVTSGTVDAEYSMQIDTADQLVMRTAEEERNVEFKAPKPLKIAAGSTITIKVIHYKDYTADFEATLFGSRY